MANNEARMYRSYSLGKKIGNSTKVDILFKIQKQSQGSRYI